MENIQCSNCRYFVPDDVQPRCAVPIWVGAELYKIHYTCPESRCALYEAAERKENTETSKH